ncbi:hypothetical protein G6F60_011530 [Rhizopus arrhizus]|nr:hypothetical protein G6F66_011359 [Rhizopus arrhizus]KAG1372174.1 hypothetical protein G6F61_011284 [Rhizopus arrhizus]KAG1393385.1 hypothetical protein G6F60_011530 [Rhizopus arrhizus]
MQHLKDESKTSFEAVESKMKRSLEDLYTIKALLKGKNKSPENHQIEQLQLDCSKYQAEANEYKNKLKEANEKLEMLQSKVNHLKRVEENVKRHELDYASWKVKLDTAKQENEGLESTVRQLTEKLEEESNKTARLESILTAKEQELDDTRQNALGKEQELKVCEENRKFLQEMLDEKEKALEDYVTEKISEIENLQDIIDKLQEENTSLEKKFCELDVSSKTKNKNKSRIPIRSSSTSTHNSSSEITDDVLQRMKRDLLLYQEKLAEMTTQNKDLIQALDRSKEYTELLKRNLNDIREESEERHRRMTLYREELSTLKRKMQFK